MCVLVEYIYIGTSGLAADYHIDGDWAVLRECDDIHKALNKFWMDVAVDGTRRCLDKKSFKLTNVRVMSNSDFEAFRIKYRDEENAGIHKYPWELAS